MPGINYHREIYQNMQYKETFYLFFYIVNEKNVNSPVNYATMFLKQWIWYNVTYMKSGITGTFIKPKNV